MYWLVLTAALLFHAQQPIDAPSGWTIVETKDGRFGFAMPGKPEEVETTVKSGAGDIRTSGYWCEAIGCKYTWERSKMRGKVTPHELEAYLNGYALGVAKHGKLIRSEKIERAGTPGRLLSMEASPGAGKPPLKVSLMFFVVGDEQIVARVIATSPDADLKSVDSYFRTVRLPASDAKPR